MLVNFQLRGNLAALNESVYVPLQRGMQSHLIEHRRMKQVRHSADVVEICSARFTFPGSRAACGRYTPN
jgi:hypothetical protein